MNPYQSVAHDHSPGSPDRLQRETPAAEVPETGFGRWFLGTSIWSRYVVEPAVNELGALLPADAVSPKRILDVGCGPGAALPLLDRRFRPRAMIAVDLDPREVARARRPAALCACPVEVRLGDAARLALANASVDLVFCHQLLHHESRQAAILRELHRVLVPGGALLLAESCRSFILSSSVQWLFAHPNEAQKSPAEYQELVRQAGFVFNEDLVRTSTPFWSRPDWGLRARLGWRSRRSLEATQVTLVAIRPSS
ncbi:MAG: class I SAM-dependent methyltransferase [Opitutae bacterium]|nr:class I SAM-dependent methyltransferase [Opitutae bacterium]